MKNLSNNIVISFCDIFQNSTQNVLDFHENHKNDLTIVVAQKKRSGSHGVCKISKKET